MTSSTPATRQVVHRIEDGMDRQQVAATTYQQRNFFTQLRDGFFSRNELFNYVLHHQVARWCAALPAGTHVLDVCCGRGLHLPMLRFQAKQLGSYTGLDIKRSNAAWLTRRVTTGEALWKEGDGSPHDNAEEARLSYYPWPTYFVEGNVAQADRLVAEQRGTHVRYGFIIYTASIEHMHPEDGRASLHALRSLASDGATLVLTCPNTPPDQDGYDTRYRAHVYEWKLAELQEALAGAGWHVHDTWGCDMGVRDLTASMVAAGLGEQLERLRTFVPQEWLVPALAPLFPKASSEVGLLCGTQPAPAADALPGQLGLLQEQAA